MFRQLDNVQSTFKLASHPNGSVFGAETLGTVPELDRLSSLAVITSSHLVILICVGLHLHW